jgi:hypothetical protein
LLRETLRSCRLSLRLRCCVYRRGVCLLHVSHVRRIGADDAGLVPVHALAQLGELVGHALHQFDGWCQLALRTCHAIP